MRQTSKVEGTKIAQAAKDLNVTSVTIRRYLSEFNIDTTTDENGIKVLPDQAMEELKTVRRLKEDGLTNPKVMEMLEESRVKRPSAPKGKTTSTRASKVKVVEVEDVEEEEVEAPKVDKRKGARRPKVEEVEVVAEAPALEEANDDEDESPAADGGVGGDATGDKPKHSLTCQTCGKVFEHMNPRLRDCLDCYRTKRKERRRGGSERHKNVIQHPIAQQAANKAQQQNQQVASNYPNGNGDSSHTTVTPLPVVQQQPHREPLQQPYQQYQPLPPQQTPVMVQSAAIQRGPVRNYRKAIEETRQITGSLKRRLERPDLPEGDRRWLEQIYAYQLILHQGWRHLSDYKNNTNSQAKLQED